MTKKQARLIQEAFDTADQHYLEKSTEWLIQFTADGIGIEYEDVVDALAMMAAEAISTLEPDL